MFEVLGRSWKLVILGAAIIGVLGFFAPFFRFGSGDTTIEVSAYRIKVGFDRIEQVGPALAGIDPKRVARRLGEINELVQHETTVLQESFQFRNGAIYNALPKRTSRNSYVPYYFLSTLLLGAIAFVALVNRELGLVGSLCTIAAGMIAVWGFIREYGIDRRMGEDSSSISTGATLLLVSGLLALVSGVGSLALGDRGGIFRRVRPS